MKRTFLLTAATFLFVQCLNAQIVADFENLNLQPDTFWNGSDDPMGTLFISGDVILPNYYDTAFGGFWSYGWAISNVQDTVTAGYTNSYASAAGDGNADSENYAVMYDQGKIIMADSSQGNFVEGVYITNNTYAYLSMRDGDNFAKQFGGTSGNDPDFFRVTIKKWRNGNMGSDSVDVYLADYRFSDNSQDYILKNWTWVDLTDLGKVDSLQFTFASSDTGQFGINTPKFFCIDDFTTVRDTASTDTTTGVVKYASMSAKTVLYPNPAEEVLNVSVNGQLPQSVSVVDLTGRTHFRQTVVSEFQFIDVRGLPKGIYVLKMQYGDGTTKSKQFIKQ